MAIFNRIWISSFSGIVCVIITVFFLSGCSGRHDRGRLIKNSNVKGAFEAYQVLPDYNYYYSGPKNYPRAVIGIRKEYLLESKFWKPVELTPEQLKKWLTWRGSTHIYERNHYGGDIISPAGKQIGIWYTVSLHTDYGIVKMIDDQTVVVGLSMISTQ